MGSELRVTDRVEKSGRFERHFGLFMGFVDKRRNTDSSSVIL